MAERSRVYKCPNHIANLNGMRLNKKWCDVTIRVDGKEFQAHKVILAANLKYFDTMFSNDSFEESKEGLITMECMKSSDLESFVSYAYTGEILLTDSNALNLLEVANYLGEDCIKGACIEFLENHMKVEEACRAYRYADAIDCITLKNAAKATILEKFEDCSQACDYLDFDDKSLADILADKKAEPTVTQKMLFEGIMKWIMHDAKNRKIHTNGLLNLIDMTKITADYLIAYFYGNTANHNDDYGIIKDIMSYYHACSKIQQTIPESEHTLFVLGKVHGKISFQFYNFTEKKWTPLQQISSTDGNIQFNGTVLNDKLYYITENSNSFRLRVFDPTTKLITTLMNNVSSRFLETTAICACSRFLYLCAGVDGDISKSDKILRYNPEDNSFITLSSMRMRIRDATAICYQDCLYILGGLGYTSLMKLNLAERYDLTSGQWWNPTNMREARRDFGVAVLDEKLYACGGSDTRRSVEVLDPVNNKWEPSTNMNHERRGFLLVAREGKLLAIGGDEGNTVEVYDPSKRQWQIDHEMSSGLQIENPIGGLISSRCVAGAK